MLTISDRKIIVRLYSQGKTQQNIANIVGCTQQMVSKWVRRFKETKSLESKPRSGRPTKLKGSTFSKLKKSILAKINSANDEYNNVSTKKIRDLITQEIGVTYSLRHVERIMHKLGFRLITPRPQHLRHDQDLVDSFRDKFKKNSKMNIWVMK